MENEPCYPNRISRGTITFTGELATFSKCEVCNKRQTFIHSLTSPAKCKECSYAQHHIFRMFKDGALEYTVKDIELHNLGVSLFRGANQTKKKLE